MEKRKCSTFQAADESRKGKPFTAVQEVCMILQAIWVATREICSRPCLSVDEGFYFFKEVKKC